MAGSFVASPELRAYAAATIGSADIIDNSIQSVDLKDAEVKAADLASNSVTGAKIKDGEVKAAEIAPDAVGASEIVGVHKLIFADCNIVAQSGSFPPGTGFFYICEVAGADDEDDVIAMDNKQDCFAIEGADTRGNDIVVLSFENICNTSAAGSANHVSIIVYDELPDKVPPG